jgi:ectoine hydroxylase-related dioxygenase (phytanoyl-CoA dioxygenase family)|eukprot:COSAG01_NODE_19260_length_1021_cov_1.109544_2_plen_94_part_00
MDQLREQAPVELSGPRGTVVLWHGVACHVVGQNTCSDVIRQASIYEFHKTPASLPDEVLRKREALLHGPIPGIWDDWSDCVKEVAAGGGRARL